MAKYTELDRSIDRSLDDFGRFLKHRWFWILLAAVVIWWFVAGPPIGQLTPPAALVLVFQLAFAFFFIAIQFLAYFYFLGRPRIYWVMPGETGINFTDYKGNPEVLDSARRIVLLMRGIKNFKEMGGEISRGLLLVGPPGTGKSYLAQCISTEAGMPFAYASASSLRGVFMGMDVLMIKNLYRKARRFARQYGGCIVFLDEFDAIGMSRLNRQGGLGLGMGAGGMLGGMGNGTGGLNELLMQMDPPPINTSWWKNLLSSVGLYHGRHQREPVLTIGATNIPESLDAALLRPGRFDRKIVVAAPSDAGRAEVIDYYLKKVKHDAVSVQKLVADTIGYTPVAIKHIINEAVVIAHFKGRNAVTYKDIVEARETHEHGIRYPRTLSLLEKRRLAYHEAGHTIAQVRLLARYQVAYVTITKRLETEGAEAFASAKPLEEVITQSADEIFADIQVDLASRAAEELFLQTRLNGVAGDLHHATRLALMYVAHLGMGDSFFSAPATQAPQDIYTDPVYRAQAEALLRKAYIEVRALLEQNRAAVIAVAETLIQREELDGDEILELIRQADAPMLEDVAEAALANIPPVTAAVAAPMSVATIPVLTPSSQNGHVSHPAREVESNLLDLPVVETPEPASQTAD